MKRLTQIIIPLVVAMSFLSCKTQKDTTEVERNSTSFYLGFNKTPCHGTCPIYQMTLNDSGALTLNAKRFMTIQGLYVSQIEVTELDSIKAAILRVDWSDLQQEYMTGYADLPSTEMIFSNTPGDTTFVRWESVKAPTELLELGAKLEEIQKSSNWLSLDLD
jgi:hypothetical protein